MNKQGLVSQQMPPEEYDLLRERLLSKENKTYKMETITGEESKSLAKTLSNDHPATVLGMVQTDSTGCKIPNGYHITSSRVKSVSNEQCEIKLTICSGDLCEMKTATYTFNPPLKSGKELFNEDGKRLRQIHNKVCGPKVHWLVTDVLALVILVTCTAIAFGTLILGMDGMIDAISKAPRLEEGISTIFTSKTIFAYAVVASFWFAIIAHGIEAVISYKLCTDVLALDLGPTFVWVLLVFTVGYPIFSRLQLFAETQQRNDDKTK